MTESAEPDDLRADELELWSSLATLLEWLPGSLDEQLARNSGLSHFEFGILYALARAPERSLRMSALAGYANSSLSRLSRAVTRLESRGCVERSQDPSDGRSTIASITGIGLDAYREALPGHVRTVRGLVFDPLTAVQQRHLLEISRRITRAIRDEAGWSPPEAGWR